MIKKFLNWWNNGSLLSYRVSYAVTHPWIIVDGSMDQIKWAWQRVFRGWDDRVIWSIDWYLAENLPLWLAKLKQDKLGTPSCFFDTDSWNEDTWGLKPGKQEIAEARWNEALDQMIDGFNAYREGDLLAIHDPKREALNKKFDKGFELFRTYFGALWD